MGSVNGAYLGGRTKKARATLWRKLVQEGAKPGVSDLLLAVARGGYHGLWIEMKDEGKTACSLTDDQADHLELMIEQGYLAVWCAGSDAAIDVIIRYLNL